MSFKIYNCDFGIVYKNIDYSFDHVREVQIEDNERNRLTRGSNASNQVGITYKDGLREPKRWTIPILQMSIELKAALDDAYNTQLRMTVYCIDRTNGSKKSLPNAILSNRPQQLTLDETPESLDVSLEFEGFLSEETYKE